MAEAYDLLCLANAANALGSRLRVRNSTLPLLICRRPIVERNSTSSASCAVLILMFDIDLETEVSDTRSFLAISLTVLPSLRY